MPFCWNYIRKLTSFHDLKKTRGRFMGLGLGLGLEDNSVRGKAGLGPMSQPSSSVDLSSIHTGHGNGPFFAI